MRSRPEQGKGPILWPHGADATVQHCLAGMSVIAESGKYRFGTTPLVLMCLLLCLVQGTAATFCDALTGGRNALLHLRQSREALHDCMLLMACNASWRAWPSLS